MERVINSKLTVYAMLSFALFTICTLIYVQYGQDNSSFWWIFDKLNDRLLAFNLLFVTSFIFRDVTYRLFTYASMGYVLIYASYEVSFILFNNVTSDFFVKISIVYLTVWALILLIVAYVSKGNSK